MRDSSVADWSVCIDGMVLIVLLLYLLAMQGWVSISKFESCLVPDLLHNG